MFINTINPTTEAPLKAYRIASKAQISRVIQQAGKAFGGWRRTSISARAACMRSAAMQLRRGIHEYAELMALEMGKPLSQGRAECEKCAVTCDYFAENAERFLAREPVPTDSEKCFVSFQPLGVILAIMPWNFPFWQVFRCAVPALMAGNVVILKPALNVAGCGLAIQQIFESCGLPGMFNTLLIEPEQISALIENAAIRAVTLTGSVRAGKAVAAQSGMSLKKTVLELGGSDPYVILEDCDLEKTVETCVTSRLTNSGQSCISAKRFIEMKTIRLKFEELFVARMNQETMGDPLDPATTVGPLARRDLRQELHSQVRRSVAGGAKLLAGGKIPKRTGWFYPPTILTNVRKGMPAYTEETFGPVAAIIPAKNEAEAIRLANDSAFGLGAAVFTGDSERGERVATEKLEAGSCFVNEMVRSDPRLPFGGIKQSGYGRELGVFGIREFVNIKTVCVK